MWLGNPWHWDSTETVRKRISILKSGRQEKKVSAIIGQETWVIVVQMEICISQEEKIFRSSIWGTELNWKRSRQE